ncbi:MAG: ABC transporter permease, partial [Elusimicrobiota bacterium]
MYRIPLGDWIDSAIEYLVANLSGITRAFSDFVDILISFLVDFLEVLPPWVLILLIGVLGWRIISLKGSFLIMAGLLLIWNFGLWDPTISTFALVITATMIAVIIGLPLGILAALYDKFNKVITPILDFM